MNVDIETNHGLSQRTINALAEVDAMPAALRECVHEFGISTVRVLTKLGIRNPKHIREIVHEVWLGARQERQTGGAAGSLDALLATGQVKSARALYQFLRDHGFAVVPTHPTRAMVNASMAEVSGFNIRCTRVEKHRLRLIAAVEAAMREVGAVL